MGYIDYSRRRVLTLLELIFFLAYITLHYRLLPIRTASLSNNKLRSLCGAVSVRMVAVTGIEPVTSGL